MFENLEYKKNGYDLTMEELKKFTSFCLALKKSGIRTRMIFRGENYQSLKEKLSLSGDNDFNKLNSLIFLIGEKGRVYRKEYKNKILNKKKIHSIDSVEIALFKYIFKKTNSILIKNKDRKEISHFIQTNKKLNQYFSNKENVKDFTNKISILKTKDDKIKIRDYYLSLLHQIGGIGFYNNSFFLSTSKDIKIAEKFASNNNNSEKIIFISWVNYPINRIGVNLNYLNNFKKNLDDIGLPSYSKSFFPKQNEISIKGGLLPQYILGYIRPERNELIINPNFFTTEKEFRQIIKYGFEIDQSNFNNAIIETDYTGYFILDENDRYRDIN
ncbi:hypothetical protein [Tenacibaculum sp. UWU-22]|uniref:hypothetical protein n=1 Tax=Tenacibaculum sp. UWU-22 TaxID=3234187 RepID=UPI0034DB6DAF